MAHNAILGKVDFTESQIIDGTHPAVILGMKMTEAGEWPQGTLLKAAAGVASPAAASDTLAGVLVASVEVGADKEEVVPVLVHGTVDRAKLLIDRQPIPGASEPQAVAALAAIGVWAV